MIRRPPRSTRTYTLFPYTTCFRSVIIGPVGFEARDLDMDAVAQFGMREFGALGHDVTKAPIARDLPVDGHRRERHAAVRRHRFGGEAGPDDEAVARRVPRRDAEAERAVAEQPALGAQAPGPRQAGEAERKSVGWGKKGARRV